MYLCIEMAVKLRTHTFDNVKLIEFPVSILSSEITKLYKMDKGLFGQFEKLLLSGEYVTPMIYFVKRCLITFDQALLMEVLEELKEELRRPLYLSFLSLLEQEDSHAFSMYLVKNRHIDYIR